MAHGLFSYTELVLATGGPVAVSNALLLDQSHPAFIGHNLDKIGAYSKRNR